MDRMKQIRLFMEVARARSFSAAAQRLGVSRASVTKHVAQLEQSMGVVLLNRTTQHVALTEPGRLLLEEGTHLLEAYEQLQSRVRHAQNEPSGTIRVGTPPAFGEMHLMPAVTAFTRRTRRCASTCISTTATPTWSATAWTSPCASARR